MNTILKGSLRIRAEPQGPQFAFLYLVFLETAIQILRNFQNLKKRKKYFSNRDKNTFFMTNENKKTSYQLIFVHIFRKKHFKDNLENFMSESLNATSTPLRETGKTVNYRLTGQVKKNFWPKLFQFPVECKKPFFDSSYG
jgi:hypothetical protein